MENELQQIMALLERTPAALDSLLLGLPDALTLANEGEHTWSAFDVVAHLIHAERTDWMPRVRMILQHGESSPFEAFERTGHQRESEGKLLEHLLDEFAGARQESLRQLRALNLQPADLARRGLHPALGRVTLGQLLATWAAHDLTHLHQIARVMAHQYREAVGPWSAYLGVLQCNGHSS
jgi:hypothetical protein